MITDYKRARRDATFLVEWAKLHLFADFTERYLEALDVMNGHDAISVLAMMIASGNKLPRLPEDLPESDGVPETGA